MGTADDRHEIELLKARYCRTLDTKDWTTFRALLADDFVGDTTDSGGPRIEGADTFVGYVRRTLGKAVTVHQVQQPEIELSSATTADGTWAMQDVVRLMPGVSLHGFGHYLETYVKADGRWLIRTSTLTRLRMEIRTPFFGFLVSDRMRRRMQRRAARSAR